MTECTAQQKENLPQLRIHHTPKISRQHRRRAHPMTRPKHALPIIREVLRISAIRSNGRVVVRVSDDILEGRSGKHSARGSCGSDGNGDVEGIFEEPGRGDRVVEGVGGVDVHVSSREGHQGPEGGGKAGAAAFAEEFDDGDCGNGGGQ